MAEEGTQSSRPRAEEIYDRVRVDALDEIERSTTALGFSGLFAGFTIGATALAYAAALVYVEGSAEKLIAALVYPVGYIAVILGRAQLFTENTLYPVLLVFDDLKHLRPTARLWAVVIALNLVGTLLFSLIVVFADALPRGVGDQISQLGVTAVERDFWTIFWAAVLSGWILALVAWLVEATESAVGAFFVIWLLTMVVGLLELDHSVATTVEVWSALLDGDVGIGQALGWYAPTLLGNTLGGVFIVSVLNYGQVRAGDD